MAQHNPNIIRIHGRSLAQIAAGQRNVARQSQESLAQFMAAQPEQERLRAKAEEAWRLMQSGDLDAARKLLATV